jgi:riboflavin transporter FmnP
MPEVTTWKLPVGLWLAGFLLKILLSIFINDTVGNWVGGTLGFLAVVTFMLWTRHVSRKQRL